MRPEVVTDEIREAEKLRRQKELRRKREEAAKLRLQQSVITIGNRATTHLNQQGSDDDFEISPELELLGLPQDANVSFKDNLKEAVRLCRKGGLDEAQIARKYLVAVNRREREVGLALGSLLPLENEAFIGTFAGAIRLVFEEANRKDPIGFQPRRLSNKPRTW